MSYMQCQKCGGMFGVIGSTVYTCQCLPKNAANKITWTPNLAGNASAPVGERLREALEQLFLVMNADPLTLGERAAKVAAAAPAPPAAFNEEEILQLLKVQFPVPASKVAWLTEQLNKLLELKRKDVALPPHQDGQGAELLGPPMATATQVSSNIVPPNPDCHLCFGVGSWVEGERCACTQKDAAMSEVGEVLREGDEVLLRAKIYRIRVAGTNQRCARDFKLMVKDGDEEHVLFVTAAASAAAPTAPATPVDEPKNDERGYGCYACGKQGLKKGQRISLVFCNGCDDKYSETIRKAQAAAPATKLDAAIEAFIIEYFEGYEWVGRGKSGPAGAEWGIVLDIPALRRRLQLLAAAPKPAPPAFDEAQSEYRAPSCCGGVGCNSCEPRGAY